MANMIPLRKSIRDFLPLPLSPEELNAIKDTVNTTARIFPSIQVACDVLDRSQIKGIGIVAAPHYLALYSERGEDALLNAGFILQQMDLYLSSRGIGSCWLGMARPVAETSGNLSFVIFLAVGTAREKLHRSGSGEFRRKNLDEIASSAVLPSIIGNVRLAPSAMNKQPWYFCGEARSCRAFSVKGRGLIQLSDNWRFIDLGIALAHLFVTAKAQGRAISFKKEDSIPSGDGREYVISVHVD